MWALWKGEGAFGLTTKGDEALHSLWFQQCSRGGVRLSRRLHGNCSHAVTGISLCQTSKMEYPARPSYSDCTMLQTV